MLEITADDIASLNDTDLRTLVGLLCEAEVRSRGHSTSAVTWGGNQDAGDGGIDVRVALATHQPIDGYVPRPSTGFQVKKPDMPPSEILKEMKPKGKLRPSIQELANAGGAYIIVSSAASVADKRLPERVDAMREALEGESKADAIHLDFYDRNRLSSWVRNHPGLIPWTRRAAGREIQGWRSYASWSNPSAATDAEFISDDAGRFYTRSQSDGDGLTVVEGIHAMREAIGMPGSSVRLVGLSGVGKTRVAQALFDARIGEHVLDPTLVIYTDEGDAPEPGPATMISALIQDSKTAIVVVDNCRPEVHRRLTELCAGSPVSLLTIEYDIQDGKPEGTETFRLEPSSIAMTETVLKSRFPELTQLDAGRISEFSGGNFRLAFVLAETVKRDESVAKLSDRQLFERLFAQRQGDDENLLQCAKVCALVYSFDGEDTSGNSELAVLASLIDQKPAALYAAAAKLMRRNLMQSRSVWRAVLPHALANFLASLALEEVPYADIERLVVRGGSERLLHSFGHRLSFLHENPVAKKIAAAWLEEGGILASPSTYGHSEAKLLFYVAPIAPKAVLDLLKRQFMSGDLTAVPDKDGFIRLLRSLAYDADLFEGAAILISRFALVEDREGAADAFRSLFYIYLSGTHATVDQRIDVVRDFAGSGANGLRVLAKSALAAMLESTHFTSSYDFDFGSHTRDYGYEPDGTEARLWFDKVLKFASDEVASNSDFSPDVMSAVARAFRGLWTSVGALDLLEGFAVLVRDRGNWKEGWIAVRHTLKYDYRQECDDSYHRLIAIEKLLRPSGLVDQVLSIVLSTNSGSLDYDDFEEDEDESSIEDASAKPVRVEEIAERLGKQVVVDPEALSTLLPDLMSSVGHLFHFGMGLGLGCQEVSACWEDLRSSYAKADPQKRNISVVRGFLSGVFTSDAELVERLLDRSLQDPVFLADFPDLQSAVPISPAGVERLLHALECDSVEIDRFRGIAWGRNHVPVDNPSLARLVRAVAQKPGGMLIALEILFFRFRAEIESKSSHAGELLDAGRDILSELEFDADDQRDRSHIASVAKSCLEGVDGWQCAKVLCGKFSSAANKGSNTARHYDDLFQAISAAHPQLALDHFFSGDPTEQKKLSRVMSWHNRRHTNPLQSIPADVVLAWCQAGGIERYLSMAAVVWMFGESNEDSLSSTWSTLARGLIDNAPQPGLVVEMFGRRIKPSGWSGSMAAILRGRLPLLEELRNHENPEVGEAADKQIRELKQQIKSWQDWEDESDHVKDERFE